MLTLDLQGAEALLGLLERSRRGQTPTDAELAEVSKANAFFLDFYGQWPDCGRADLAGAIRDFDDAERVAPGALPQRLAAGFRRAADELPLLRSRLAWLHEVDTVGIADRVAVYLPQGTLLDSVIHITVDEANNAFMYRGEMGASLLRMTDPATFADAVAHELHHAGIRLWREQDPVHQALARERSGRTVAMLHVENLLSEGLANYYLTPGYVFRTADAPPEDDFQARLARLRREDGAFFRQAETVLAQAMAPDADYDGAFEALKAIAMDLEDYMLPAGAYLGARMIQTMAEVHPPAAIVDCVRDLPAFLTLCNDAARRIGAFVFDDALVAAFAAAWQAEAAKEVPAA